MRASILLAAAISILASSAAAAACACVKVSNPGLYCGYCPQVLVGSYSYAYECNTSGGCYEYGGSSVCTSGVVDAYHCGGRDKWKRNAMPKAKPVAEVASNE